MGGDLRVDGAGLPAHPGEHQSREADRVSARDPRDQDHSGVTLCAARDERCRLRHPVHHIGGVVAAVLTSMACRTRHPMRLYARADTNPRLDHALRPRHGGSCLADRAGGTLPGAGALRPNDVLA